MKKINKRRKVFISILGPLSLASIFVVAACGGSLSDVASSKKDANGNPLAYGISDGSGNTSNTGYDQFLNDITPKQSTKTQLFTSMQSELYKYLYNQEQTASETAAITYNNKDLKLPTYAEELADSQNFFDDEKSSYQQTYREKWQSFWEDHLITTYNAINEDQAVQNRTADQIKSDALRRYTLDTTNQKAPNFNFTYKDLASQDPNNKYLIDGENVYYRDIDNPNVTPSDNTNMQVLITKSFVDADKNPIPLIQEYKDTNAPVYISHFLVGIKPGADGTATSPWTVTTDTLKKLYSKPSSSDQTTVLQLLQQYGMTLGDGGTKISDLGTLSKYLNLYSDNSTDKTSYGSIGNYLFENINQNLKTGFAIGLTQALRASVSAGGLTQLPLISQITNPITDATFNKGPGLWNIINDSIHQILNDPTYATPINDGVIGGLSSNDLTNIGINISKAFQTVKMHGDPSAVKGRSLAYMSDDYTNAVLISEDGIDFTRVDGLEMDPAPTNKGSPAYKAFFDNQRELFARTRFDLQQSAGGTTLLYNVPGMVQSSLTSGNLQNYPLQQALNDPSFVTWLLTENNLSSPTPNTKFTQADVDTAKQIILEQYPSSLVAKNGAIYKWISDYYDSTATDPNNPVIDKSNFSISELYKYIKEQESA